MTTKVFGRDVKDVRNELQEVIRSEAYINTLGRFIQEQKEAFYQQALKEDHDLSLRKALGGAQALQAIQDWIATIDAFAKKDFVKERKKENKTHGRQQFRSYSDSRSSTQD